MVTLVIANFDGTKIVKQEPFFPDPTQLRVEVCIFDVNYVRSGEYATLVWPQVYSCREESAYESGDK